MDNFINIIVSVLVFTGLILLLYSAFSFKTKSEKEYDRKLKESLADEHIIDPETGAKLTLEQAESGHWVSHDNEFRTVPESEIDKLYSEEDKNAEIALNYLRESREYRKTTFTDLQLSVLDKTKTLNTYDDWTYSDLFEFNEGFVFLPAPEIHGITYFREDYKESHLMFWVKINDIGGHYFFREKSSSEKLLDLIRDDDELKLNDYECFTIKKSFNIILINRVLKNFENEKGLEIEINNEDLFIKTTKLFNLTDIKRIEKIVNSLKQ